MDFIYELYQVKRGNEYRDFRFERLSWLRKRNASVSRENYDCVYRGFVSSGSKEDALEKLFEIFNCDRPSDFMGHSMSVSDVVVLNGEAWYCDSFGFVDVTKEW